MTDVDAHLADRLRDAFRQVASGVCIVTATTGNGPVGLTCTSVISVSLNPPLVLFCPAKSSSTWPLMTDAERFAINVMGGDSAATVRRFATRGVNRFVEVAWHESPSGAPLLDDALVALECRPYARHDGGDHEIVVYEVVAIDVKSGPALVFHGGDFFSLAPPDHQLL